MHEEELPPPPSATPGTVIAGRYRVERLLGDGSMGVVLEATDLSVSKQVALKLLRLEYCTPELLARFDREARVAAQLPAAHIACVTDSGRSEAGEPFLVMELLVGRDLSTEIAYRGTFPIEEAVGLILQATAGVAAAHAAGLVHRDLKPANLFLVDRRGGVTVKVLDFGLSKEPLREGDTALTRTTMTFGTPQYMSPEQIQSAKHVDARSDQHALAMILFELLTGKPPYDSATVTSLMIAIATEPVPSVRAQRPEVPPQLEEAILRGLAKLPEERFPDVVGFARAIAPFAGVSAAAAVASVEGALLPFALSPHAVAPAWPAVGAMAFDEEPLTMLRPLPRVEPAMDVETSEPVTLRNVVRRPPARARRVGVFIGIAAALLLAAGLGIFLLLSPSLPMDGPEGAPSMATGSLPSASPSTSAAPSAPPHSHPSVRPKPGTQSPGKPGGRSAR
jgi:eukaryotic-like serine/threonine-protein kinase